MRVLIFILYFLVVACKDATRQQQPQQKAWTAASVDSFRLDNQKTYLHVLVNEKRDSFQLICKNENSTYLDIMLEQPPGEVRAQNISGDSFPEIIVDDCLGCDLGRIRLFSFDRSKQHFTELKGTDGLLSEIYNLNGTDFIYNIACFNQGGCESTLLKVVGDNCISVGKMYVPYSEEPIQLTTSLSQPKNNSISKPKNMDTDSLILYIWSEHFLNKSQQPTAAFVNSGF